VGKDVANRLGILDSLRGLAALAVCLFHFAGRDDLLPNGPLKSLSKYGSLGVVVFFVISGFVIPWSMARGGYRLTQFSRFFLKRLIRLEPPYIVAVASAVALTVFYSAVKDRPFPPTPDWWFQVLTHGGYLTRFAGFDWLDDVYWTLAIEFQYYLLIGLMFPLLSHARADLRWAASVLLALVGLSALTLPIKVTILTYTPIFVLGILPYQFRIGLIDGRSLAAAWVGLTALLCWTQNPEIALTAAATSAVIANMDRGWGPLNSLGTISYSLYLFHATLGGVIINLGIKHTSSAAGRYFVFAAALTASFAVAIAVYWLVERPAQRISARIRYRPKTVPAPPILDALAPP
jgi:peptidoglycan/LPS O-acetylase OafA/YrhL